MNIVTTIASRGGVSQKKRRKNESQRRYAVGSHSTVRCHLIDCIYPLRANDTDGGYTSSGIAAFEIAAVLSVKASG